MASMPRFVLLYHDCPAGYERPSHWDFMLETGDVLRTWALNQLPCNWQAAHARTAAAHAYCPAIATANEVVAEQLGDHRPDYLDLEGPLSGGRGTVVRIATGTYDTELNAPGELRLVINGSEVVGSVRLLRSKVDRSQWKLSTQY